jgi:Zn-dependent protease with chaperone function
VILYTAFRSWNRNCEFSADRAGLLACGDLNKAISALVKLVAPNMRTQSDFERALTMIDAQDDNVLNQFGELFQSHPMVIRRINQLREYAATSDYKNLQASMNRNLAS